MLGGDFVAMDEGTGIVQMAPGFGEDDQRACEAAGIPVVCPVDDRRAFTDEVPDFAGVQVFDANARIIERLAASGVLVRARGVHPQLPALLAYRHAPHLPGDELVVRGGDRSSKTAWSSSTGRSPGCPSTSATAPSASGWKGRGTGRSAGTAFGATPIPVWKSDDPAYPRVDVYGSLDELEADFGVRPKDLHRPAIDELHAAEPGRPDGSLDHATHPRRLRLLVRVGLDALRSAPLPLREHQALRGALPGRLHRRVRRPDPGLVLHIARAGHRAVRPAAFCDLHRPRHRARRGRAQALEETAQLPRPRGGVRLLRRGRHALVPAQLARASRQRRRHRGEGPRRAAAPGVQPDLEQLVLPVAVRGRRPPHRAGENRPDRGARPLRARQDAPARRGRDRGHGRLRPRRCLLAHLRRSSTR